MQRNLQSTHQRIVFTADGVRGAGAPTPNANDGDRGTIDSQQDVQVREDNSKKTQQKASGGRVSLLMRLSESRSDRL